MPTFRAAFIHFTACLAGCLAGCVAPVAMEANSQAENSLCVHSTEAVKQDVHTHMPARTRACKQTRTCNLATGLNVGYGECTQRGLETGCNDFPRQNPPRCHYGRKDLAKLSCNEVTGQSSTKDLHTDPQFEVTHRYLNVREGYR